MESTESAVRVPLGLRLKICYGVGHILNDLCASMWFTYLLLFLHKVVKFSNIIAGTLMLVGQVADAVATPLVGLESDRTGNCKYGRRKIWHLVGVICVVLSFPFIFNLCITCEDASRTALFLYYAPFVVIFQFGWASTQISHLALIPELTTNEEEKTSLNAIRYASTVGSNIFVFSIVWIFLNSLVTGSLSIGREDSKAFTYIVFVILGTGLFFMAIFHIGVKEPYRTCSSELASSTNMRSSQSWKLWFKKIQFYQVAMLYMSTRLVVNLSQVYLPMYVTETLFLTKETIAIMPLIVYTSGFISTFFAKPFNQYLGRKVTFFIGCIIITGACISFKFISKDDSHKQEFMYGASAALGIGGSIMLITALAIISEMIGNNKETGAFVYGAMSFVDKLSNGIAVQMIQAFHPCSHSIVCCGKCAPFYRDVMTYVAGGAAILALLSLLSLWKTKIGQFDQATKLKTCSAQRRLLKCDQADPTSTISGSHAENGSLPNGTTIPYYPNKQSKYGSMECQKPTFDGSIQQPPQTCHLKQCANIEAPETGNLKECANVESPITRPLKECANVESPKTRPLKECANVESPKTCSLKECANVESPPADTCHLKQCANVKAVDT